MRIVVAFVYTLMLLSACHPTDAQNANGELTFDFDKSNASALLHPPGISAVVGDATDPANTTGVAVKVANGNQAISASAYIIPAKSNNETVVPNTAINITKANGSAIVRIKPFAEGYATITLTLTAQGHSKTLEIDYAASANISSSLPVYWHTGVCDASNAVDLDNDYFLTGDDEQNTLFVYNRYHSGAPLTNFNYGNLLGLPDCANGMCSEVDMEAVAKSPSHPHRNYWLGSMSNGKAPKFKDKPNRNRIFATEYTLTGSQTTTTFVGYYAGLRNNIIKWGDQTGYQFSKAAAAEQDCKSPEGFNAEGMVFGPDNITLFIGLRAPMVPVGIRDKAVIVPILNFEAWFANGTATTPPNFGSPIELDLGGRAIRDIIRLSNGTYAIAAGNSGPNVNSAIYKWTGNATDAPALISQFNTNNLNIEGLLEIKRNGQTAADRLEVVCDDGGQVYYGDATQAKDLANPEFKKFKSVILIASQNVF